MRGKQDAGGRGQVSEWDPNVYCDGVGKAFFSVVTSLSTVDGACLVNFLNSRVL